MGSPAVSLVWFVILLAFFYFILIRPQQKAMKEHQKLVSALEVEAEVVTRGGIYGVIKTVEDDTIMLKIDEKVVIKVDRNSIDRLQSQKA